MKKTLSLAFLIIVVSCNIAHAATPSKTSKQVKKQSVETETASPKQSAAGFADIVENLLPTVVNISTTQDILSGNNTVDQILLGELPKAPLFEDLRNQLEGGGQGQKKKLSSIGSGFIISKDGFITTNYHVIEEADEITVGLDDGSKYKAKLVGIDKKTDLALLKINADKELKFATFGNSDKARIGDWVIIVGNPYGLGGSVSVGIVSARSRSINNGQSDDLIQTDASINKGNSGGPMFNTKGEVIGISTAIFSPSGSNVGIGFATPSATASAIVKQLKEQGEVIRGWLGVSIQDLTEEMAESMKIEKIKGAFVIDVAKDGPADKAGIVPSDVITKFDDQEITEMKILPKTVAKYPIGKSAKITILRQGKVKVLNVKVAKQKDEDEVRKIETKSAEKKQFVKTEAQVLGLGLSESISATKGLLITEISPKSEAAEKNIMIGDIIISANQAPVSSIENLQKIIEDSKKSTKKLFLFMKRGEANYAIVLTVK